MGWRRSRATWSPSTTARSSGLDVMPDHVHLLVEVPPAVPLSRLVQLVKGRSSRRLRQEFAALGRLPALWAPSWFVSTVGGAPLDVVKRYVEKKREA